MERLFVLASHGTFAEGIYSSVKMIMGDIKNVRIINAYVETMDLQKQIKELIADNQDKEFIVITDIFGGSVNNEFEKYLCRPDFHLIAGMNLPLLLEMFSMAGRACSAKEMIEIVLRNTQNAVRYCNAIVKEARQDEDF